ncbi:MAG: YggS family pyridoxal phosphate-dependent enzyme [Cyanophyceae cyanobacterium]
MSSVAQRIEQIYQQLPSNVRLIAVTKQVSIAAMREAYAAGVRDFGESRIQEALPKQEQLRDLSDLRWHFLGHIQTNKAKKVIENFQWIHSVDSLKLALRLNQLAAQQSVELRSCLQVKILPDPQKYGWTVPELQVNLPKLDQCNYLGIQGLMTILPLGLSESQALSAFSATRKLAHNIEQQCLANIAMQQLSMGMSADYRLATQAGATMIRLGRILFGDRPQ